MNRNRNSNIKNTCSYIFMIVLVMSLYMTHKTPFDTFINPNWKYKLYLITCATLSMTYSYTQQSTLNDHFIFPFLVFLNVAILIPNIYAHTQKFNTPDQDPDPEKKYKYNINMLAISFLIFILLTFRLNHHILHKGAYKNPNTFWIYAYVLSIAFWHFVDPSGTISNYNPMTMKAILIFLVSYPLLFDLKYYPFYRLASLSLLISPYYYFYLK